MFYSTIQYRIRCQRRPLFLMCMILILIIYLILLIVSPISTMQTPFKKNFVSNSAYKKIRSLSDTKLSICGTIKKIEYKEDNTVYTVIVSDSSALPLIGHKVRAYIKNNSSKQNIYTLHIGEAISLSGTFKSFDEPMNEGQFNSARYYLIRKTYGMIYAYTVYSCGGQYDYLADKLHRLRVTIENTTAYYLSADESGIINALILGDRGTLDNDTKTLYQNAGIAHILSLSGLHIATLGLMLVNLLKRLHINRYLAAFTASLIMIMYSIMTGMSVSTTRALIMFILGIIASLLGRSYDLITGAAVSAVIIILANPLYIFDNGFLLSFFAVIGIGYVYPAFSTLCKPIDSLFHAHITKNQHFTVLLNLIKLAQLIFRSLIFSFSIQISTLPIVINSFYQISTFSILINLFVIPLMTILLLFGLFLCVTSLLAACVSIPAIAMPLSILSRLNALILHVILYIYNYSSDFCVSQKGSLLICKQSDNIQLVIYYILLAFVIIRVRAYKRRCSKSAELHSTKYPRILLSSLIIMFSALLILLMKPQNNLTIKNIYVGQGDCTLIYGKDTKTILIDAGSSDIKEVGKYNVIPLLKASGIKTIDYLFISHMDTDHMSACIELLADSYYGKHIGKIIISEYAYMYGEDNYNSILEAANELGIKIYFIRYGQTLQANRLSITCLSPASSPYSNINDNSLVLYMEDSVNGFNMIFTGDISQCAEENIIDSLPGRINDINNISYLKIAHHGSSGSSCSDYVNRFRPGICVISAGINNPYGHPHIETINRLRSINSQIYRTDEDGQISIFINKKKLWVRKYLQIHS